MLSYMEALIEYNRFIIENKQIKRHILVQRDIVKGIPL